MNIRQATMPAKFFVTYKQFLMIGHGPGKNTTDASQCARHTPGDDAGSNIESWSLRHPPAVSPCNL